MNSAMRLVAVGQGVYYLLTGLWAIFHRPSFEIFTGPKTDYWLVVTVSLQICAVGVTLLTAAWRNGVSAPVRLLALCSAAGFFFVDVYYPMVGRIAATYLLDAGPQFTLVVAWLVLSVWASCRQTPT